MPEGFQRGVRKVREASLRAWEQPRRKARLDSTRGYSCLRWLVDSAGTRAASITSPGFMKFETLCLIISLNHE